MTGTIGLAQLEAFAQELSAALEHESCQEDDVQEHHVRGRCVVDVSGLDKADSAAVMVLTQTLARARERGLDAQLVGIPEHLSALFALIPEVLAQQDQAVPPPRPGLVMALERLGRGVKVLLDEATDLLALIGQLLLYLPRLHRLRLAAFVTHLGRSGLDAIPIVALLSFLIGIVIAFLVADQLERFGAGNLTINLVGLATLRETGVLLAALLVAGRSGAAITAEIGTMRVNEETDAIRTLGIDLMDALIAPRVLALFVTLPLITGISNLAGIMGGGIMCWLSLDISPQQFLEGLIRSVTLKDFMVGLSKAPVHGLIIGLIACHKGLKTKSSAESVGRMTTQSVVESIFLVIVATAAFAVMFTQLGI